VTVRVANFTGTFSGATMSKARPVILSRPRIINVGFAGAAATALALIAAVGAEAVGAGSAPAGATARSEESETASVLFTAKHPVPGWRWLAAR
jgi:hypothetical protein